MNTLTAAESRFVTDMDRLAGWYASHKFGTGYGYTVPQAEEGDESYDGRIISMRWSVYSDVSVEIGHVSWSIEATGDGWDWGFASQV